jgi:glycosyltransferase involved in cell wall biosynthesis
MSAPPLLVTGSPPSVGVVGRLGEVASVYFCMDDFLHLPDVSPEMLGPLEQRLLQRVDAVVATARSLLESKRPRSGKVYYLPQGVNYEHFAAPQPQPSDLARLPRPWIGFAGGVTTPVDVDLVHRLAAAFSTGSIVLVGPVALPRTALEAPNIHLLGPRLYRDLPGYLQAFDVGLIPYVLNPHTIAVDPLKLLEYLAAGIPVVTTDLPEVRKYSQAVSIASTHDAFVAAVRTAIERPEGTPRQRQSVAREHGWNRRAADLLEVFADVVEGRSSGVAVG